MKGDSTGDGAASTARKCVALTVCSAILIGLVLWWSSGAEEASGTRSGRPGSARGGSSLPAVAPTPSEFKSPDVAASPDVREEVVDKAEALAARRRVAEPNPDAVTISGRILDPWSVPLDGARVRVAYLDRKSQVYMRPVFADVDGRFELRSLEPGVITLEADHPDHLAESMPVGELHKGDVRENIELRLGVARTVTGTVFWPDHTPARWVSVEAFDAPRPYGSKSLSLYSDRRRALSDEDGRFEIRGFGSDPIRLKASALADDEHAAGASSERFSAWSNEVIPGHGSVVLVLEQGARIRGRVVDEFGAPWTSGNILVLEVGSKGRPLLRRFQDKDGSFDVRKLFAGAYEVAASGGAAGAGPSVTVEAPGIAENLELIAPRGAKVAGIVSFGGVSVAGAEVGLRFLHGQGLPALSDHLSLNNPWETRTDEQGRFVLEHVRAGTYLLTARHATLGRTAIEIEAVSGEGPRDLVIELEPTGRIEGRLAGEVRPAADRGVRISGDVDSLYTSVRTDAAGRFAVEELMPGQYVVRLDAADDSNDLPEENDEAVILADVLPGQTTSVVLGGMRRNVRIDGRVMCNGVPQSRIEVWMSTPDLGTFAGDDFLATSADDEGRFVLERPHGGYFELFFGPEGAGGPYAEVFLPDGAELKRTFELPAGRIAGFVLDREGSPARGARVRIEGEPDFVPRTTTADAEGAFSFSYVEPGRYVLGGGGLLWGEGVSTSVYGYERSQPFELKAGQNLEGLSVTLPAAASLRGRILPRQGGGVLEEVVYVSATPLKFGGTRIGEYAEIDGDHYAFTSMGPGEYKIDVLACCEHGGKLTRTVTVSEGENVVLDLTVE